MSSVSKVDILRRSDPVMQLKRDESDPTCIYIGMTPKMATLGSQPLWQIHRIENKDGVTTTLFAKDAKYSAIWDNRSMYFPPCEGNQTVAGFTDTNVVTAPTIRWLDFAAANVEVSLALPNGTKRFIITNDGVLRAQVAYAAGDSGVAGAWYPIDPAASHFESELGANQTVYARVTTAPGPSDRLIVLSWA